MYADEADTPLQAPESNDGPVRIAETLELTLNGTLFNDTVLDATAVEDGEDDEEQAAPADAAAAGGTAMRKANFAMLLAYVSRQSKL